LSKRLAVAFPLIQILSAAIGLSAWVALELLASAPYQALPIQVYAIAAVASLPLTLGLPYLLPNEFRGSRKEEWTGTGPWSASLTVATWASVAAAACGFALTLTAAFLDFDGIALVGSWLSAAALIAGSIMATQLARITMNVPKMLMSTWGNLAVPVTALALLPLNPTYVISALGIATVSLAGTIYFAAAARRQLISLSSGLSQLGRTIIRQAVVLIPHLFAFSVLMQGLRLSTSLVGSTRDLVSAHLLMLLVSIGGTLVASIHALIVVRVQTSSVQDLSTNVLKNSRIYLTLALSGSLASLAAAKLAPFALEGFPLLDAQGALAFASVIPSLVMYYALSGILLRSGATHLLLAASVSAVATFLILSVVFGPGDINEALAAYAISMTVLPFVCALLSFFTSRSTRRIVVQSLIWMILAQVPTIAIVVASVSID
jgi:hypothetical protein